VGRGLVLSSCPLSKKEAEKKVTLTIHPRKGGGVAKRMTKKGGGGGQEADLASTLLKRGRFRNPEGCKGGVMQGKWGGVSSRYKLNGVIRRRKKKGRCWEGHHSE